MRYSGLLRNAEWHFHADVSGYPIGSMFKGQVNQGFLTLDDVTDTFSRNVGTELPLYAG
jgi:hypothetical protein